MFDRLDYTILDDLTEICEVVDFNLRYLYVNEAAAEREHVSKDKLIGHTMLEVHPNFTATHLFLHLKVCLQKRKSAEFEDKLPYPDSALTRWKIKIDPVAEGALVRSTGITTRTTKVRIKKRAAHAII